MCALESELFAHRLFNWSVANNCLLRSTDGTVVKAFASQNILHCLWHISGSLNTNRNVAWANSEGRLSRRVCGTDKPNTSSRQNHGGLAMLHQRFRTFDGCGRHAADRLGGQSFV